MILSNNKFSFEFLDINLELLERNILLESDTNYDEFDQMSNNMGAYAFVLVRKFFQKD